MNITYQVRRSSRKSISIRITPQGEVKVSAPYFVPDTIIDNFVQSKEKRIQNHLNNLPTQHTIQTKTLTKQQKELALIQILPRVEYYANLMHLTHQYGTIKITNASTKRGSCSRTGNLMFHRRLSELPLFALDYVIVHELAHLVHFNHSKNFWNLVEIHYPHYQETKKRLKENGHHWSIS